MQGKKLIEQTSHGVWDALYRDFVLRDLVGYVLPGYILWATFLHTELIDLMNGKLSNLPPIIDVGMVLISLPCAFITGRALYTFGRIIGIIRNYPLLESAKRRDILQKRFIEKHTRDSSEYKLRERYLSLKLASGTNGLAILICAVYFTYNNVSVRLPISMIWALGFLLIIDHFRTQQRQWNFERISIGEEVEKNSSILNLSVSDVLVKFTIHLIDKVQDIFRKHQ